MGKKKTVQKQEQPAPAQQAETTTDKKQKKANKKQQKPAEKPQPQKTTGKTKQIKKEQKPAKQQKPVPQVQKKPKAAKKQETNVQVFTPDFYNRLNTFQSYYKQVMQRKSSVNNTDLSDELSSVNTRVRQALQEASSKILKQELVSLQQWIEGQQKRLKDQIRTVEKCLQESQKSLQSTKAFTVDQIRNQLTLIQKRIDQKQQQLDQYGSLLTRSKAIYSQQQPQKTQQAQVQADNNEGQNGADQDLDLDLNQQ